MLTTVTGELDVLTTVTGELDVLTTAGALGVLPRADELDVGMPPSGDGDGSPGSDDEARVDG